MARHIITLDQANDVLSSTRIDIASSADSETGDSKGLSALGAKYTVYDRENIHLKTYDLERAVRFYNKLP